MKYKRLSIKDAETIINDYDQMSDSDFDTITKEWKNYTTRENDQSYSSFRNTLLTAVKNALRVTEEETDYTFDLLVGLCLYQLMPLGEDLTVVSANDDDIWRYISVIVMPDITYLRYPDPKKGDVRINRKRFYLGKRRIWLKTLWWYIHLSWQGTEEKTFNVLKENATDNINKLIETPGKGYRLSLYRNIMLEYSKVSPHKAKEFAAITKLNNAKCMSVEPELVAGGENEYAKQLIAEVVGSEKSNEPKK